VAPPGKEKEFAEHVATSIAMRLGTIASGEKLLRDPAKLLSVRDEIHGKTEAGEMEAAGVVEACRRANVPWLVVRGISDFGDELKDDRFHAFAARAAAAVLVDFIAWGLDLASPLAGLEVMSPLFRSGQPSGAPPRHNPFIFGRPIDQDEDFFGREQEKAWILDAIAKGQPVQILGESLMGKTSLLKWVQRHVLPDRAVVWVDPTRGLTPASMVRAIAEALGEEEIASTLDDDASAQEAGEAVDALVPFVLLMDDADALAEQGEDFDDGFFGVLRTHVQHRTLTWVSASRRNLYDLFEEKGLPSRFLNDGMKVWVGPLDKESARLLAARGAAADVDRIIEETGGLAYGVQWLGDFLHRRPRAIEPACDAYADAVEAILGRWWSRLAVEERQGLQRCLGGAVEAATVDKKTRRMLRRLVEKGLLAEREGQFVVEGAAWREFVGNAG
jgi:hypothetical protein